MDEPVEQYKNRYTKLLGIVANTLVTATRRLSQPCGPLPVKDCRVRHEGNENEKTPFLKGNIYLYKLGLLTLKADCDTIIGVEYY